LGQSWGLKRSLLGAAALSVFALSLGDSAFAQEGGAERYTVRIESGSLADALRTFSTQSGVPVMFSERQVSGLTAKETIGSYTPDVALQCLLEGSGLEAVQGPAGAYVLRSSVPASGGSDREQESGELSAPERIETSATGDAVPELRAQTVIVTGTSLRGLAPESSPLQVFTREDIQASGVTTTEQFVRTLPQNFGGGSSEFASNGYPNDINSRSNTTYGSSANLRGLGSRGTLVLINGMRTAPSSSTGDFVDVSLIPVTAIERVDVLTDGASSIYGGDAVAGVINFVLREDFDGAESGLRIGSVTDGGLREYRFSQALGRSWSRGNVLATYEYFDRSNLTLSERPGIGLPLLTNGDPIPFPDKFDLLPEQKRHSGVISARQDLSDRVSASLMALYSKRNASGSNVLASGSGIQLKYETESEALQLNAGLDFQLSDTWFAKVDASSSNLTNDQIEISGFESPSALTSGTVKSESNVWSIDAQLAGDLFRTWGGTIKLAGGGHFRREDFRNRNQAGTVNREAERDVKALYGELLVPLFGDQNALPGLRRLELNLSARSDDYSDFGSSVSPKAGLLWSPAEDLLLRASYSESFAPPPLGRVGALDRSATVIPYQLILTRLGFPLPDPSLADVDYMLLAGTSQNLRPEESRAFTTGFDFTKDFGNDQWSVNATYYNIEFRDRLGAVPVPNNVNPNRGPEIAWNNPSAFPDGAIVFFPSAAEISEILASLSSPARLNNGATLDNIGIVSRLSLTQNVSTVQTSGIDFTTRYATDLAIGRVSAGFSGSYILEFLEKAGPSTPEVDTVNTLYSPVALKLRASLGLSRGPLNAAAHINYLDRYNTDTSAAARPIGSWTTSDLSISYDVGQMGWLGDATVSVSAINLFDVAPPRAPSLGSIRISGYDPANASPLGRFLAIELRTRF